jgi:hypothetical protein
MERKKKNKIEKPIRRARKIMLIRHAEKPAVGEPPYGVTAEGKRESESLTVRGWQRAGALAEYFATRKTRSREASLAVPQFLYASKPKRRNGSRRSVETLEPLAEKLALRINAHFQKAETKEMLEEVFLCAGVVLICWQHVFLPEIASHILGTSRGVPHEWPEDRFDMVWVFNLDSARGRYTFKQVPQSLLMGDWASPIK